ncbi:MAG: hypothetical protein ACPGRX_04750 [Bdellovibrionales bacterium]
MTKTTLITAAFAGVVSAAAMTYFYNNSYGTNNEVAAKAGMATAAALIAAKSLKVI